MMILKTNLLHQVTKTIKELNATFPADRILVGGDFSRAPDEWMDRRPSRYLQEHNNQIIGDFISNNRLRNVWRT